MKRTVLLGFVAVLGVTASVLWMRAGATKAPPQEAQVEPPPEKQAAAEQARASRRHELASLAQSATTEPDREPSEEPTRQPRALTPDERNKKIVEATKRVLDRALAVTPPDARWTQETSSTLRQRLAEPDFGGSRLDAVECTEALCKISLRHTDQESWMQFRQALRKPPFVSNTFFSFDVATGQSVIYTAPRGQDLPPVSPSEG